MAFTAMQNFCPSSRTMGPLLFSTEQLGRSTKAAERMTIFENRFMRYETPEDRPRRERRSEYGRTPCESWRGTCRPGNWDRDPSGLSRRKKHLSLVCDR